MGYVFVMSPCLSCGMVFSYNPMKVPSSSVLTGTREPICAGCFERLNKLRVSKGLEPWTLMPGAYEPCNESELA
jgi:hypothetical protein